MSYGIKCQCNFCWIFLGLSSHRSAEDRYCPAPGSCWVYSILLKLILPTADNSIRHVPDAKVTKRWTSTTHWSSLRIISVPFKHPKQAQLKQHNYEEGTPQNDVPLSKLLIFKGSDRSGNFIPRSINCNLHIFSASLPRSDYVLFYATYNNNNNNNIY